MKKKYSKSLKFLIPSFLVLGSSAILSSTILSSCVSNNKTNITISSQTGINQELNTNDENGLTLSVEAISTQGNSLSYQWFVNKNTTNWELIEGATYPTYNVSKDDIKDVNSATSWKYKAEIYQDGDKTIKTETKVITVNIKPVENSSTEEEGESNTPNQPEEETPPTTTPDDGTNKPGTDVTPPDTPEVPKPDEKPETTPPTPNEPSTPEEIPPATPDNPTEDVITKDSVQLKNSTTTLPSQYLTNLTETKINEGLLITNFDTSKVTNVSYSVDSFNDKDGTLSLTMTYTSNARSNTHKFDFTNLMKISEGANYQISFNGIKDNKYISALDLVEKSNNVESFKSLLTEWDKLGVKSRIRVNNSYLSMDYFTFDSSPIITGFNNNWFIKNRPITIKLSFKDAKIKYFYKDNKESDILSSTFNSNTLNNTISIQLVSAVDYLQYKITSNESYTEDKTAEEYYKEINDKGTAIIEPKLVNGQWLSNVTNELTYNGQTYKYKVQIGHKTGIFLNKDKKLFIPINVKYESNPASTPVSSTKFRNIEIKSLK